MEDISTKDLKYKLIILGDIGVGKTSFIKRFDFSNKNTKYHFRSGINTTEIDFLTSIGNVKFNVWDIPRVNGRSKELIFFYFNCDCAIIMFDVCSRITYKNIVDWKYDIERIRPNIPILIVGNKIDKNSNRKVKPKQITFPRKKGLKYIEISSNANYNIEEVFLYLMKMLTKNDEIFIIKGPELDRNVINIDENIIRCDQRELEALEKEELSLSDEEEL